MICEGQGARGHRYSERDEVDSLANGTSGMEEGRSCIFCGGRPLTTEHTIPVWLAKLLNALEPEGPKNRATQWEEGGLTEFERSFGASLPSITVKAVCRPCNTGWMSKLERRAQPIMAPMIRGETVRLTGTEQLEVAAWAAKTFMVSEFHGSGPVVNRPEDRRLLRQLLRPPAHHRIRLASDESMDRQPVTGL
jgi:hypothetical protein